MKNDIFGDFRLEEGEERESLLQGQERFCGREQAPEERPLEGGRLLWDTKKQGEVETSPCLHST